MSFIRRFQLTSIPLPVLHNLSKLSLSNCDSSSKVTTTEQRIQSEVICIAIMCTESGVLPLGICWGGSVFLMVGSIARSSDVD